MQRTGVSLYPGCLRSRPTFGINCSWARAEIDSPANVLRSYIAKWLIQFDEVQAYISAQPSDGGLGATWVMLRKSDRAKANNRERQQKRRG